MTTHGATLSRRELLTGPGLFLFFRVEAAFPQPGRQGYPSDFNAYLRVGADERVTCFVGKVELGQGSKTSLAQLLAEELDVALDSVDMVMGDTDLCPWDGGTFGSQSHRIFGPVLRGAGAEARAVLLQLAAERLQAPAERLRVEGGVVTDPSATDKRVTYAQLVQGKRIERHLEKTPVKPVKAYTVVGQSPRRKDALEKVTGRARYAGDMTLPGTLHARVLRPPAHGATLKGADTAAAEKIEGARVVRDGDLIAILHERPDVADKALELIRPKAQFIRPEPSVDDKSIFEHLLKTAPPPRAVGESGNLAEGEKLASTITSETYLNSYV
ncbi:MAG: hypothetical protein FJW34_18870, partial [Acidobacteria bacterium]|nr:hypothetical protein [Acidobacteriota bacterium]